MEMIGFFQEMHSGGSEVFHESIKGKVRSQTSYPKSKIVGYLQSGYPIFDIMETTSDVIEKSFQIPGGSSLMSDGQFVWRLDLAAYVETYNIDLPSRFLSFVIENEFSVPSVSRQRLLTISIAAGNALGFHVDGGAGRKAGT
ncbi:hypothetical protein ACFPN0_04975 [Kitasatospora cinereorecta]